MQCVYYTGVKLRFFTLLLLTVFIASCDRGSKPRVAPDFTVRDSDRTVALKDLKGKPIVLNFWASYCVPCIQEMPSLMQLQKRMGPKITVLAISVDFDGDAYHKFLRKHNIDFLTVWDPEKKTSDLYGTVLFPETYIIDAAGRIRRKIISNANFMDPDLLDFLSRLSESNT
jgi:cytochrome c biogenesis protein CcmG/thiol:disulfide interchange protein DsbE